MSLPFFLLFLFSVICGIDAITTPSIDTSPQVLNYPGYTLSGGETGRFIVVFKPAESVATRVSLEAQIALASAVDILDFDLGNQLAFAANLTSAAFALLLSQSTIDYIVPDAVAHANALSCSSDSTTRTTSLWNLDRIDSRERAFSGSYTSPSEGGAQAHVYVLDTGIRATHVAFTGRMGAGANFVNDGGGTNDCNGHGTHVAGTVGGTGYGVAQRTILHAVRVLGCDGSGFLSNVIRGLEWVRTQGERPAIASLSLGAAANQALDDAVQLAAAAGVTVVVAAGNSNTDACNSSPARSTHAITVGATDIHDHRASFSNYGTCVDLFAPGVDIVSASIASDTASTTLSGTSMACPAVSGLAALLLANSPTTRSTTSSAIISCLATNGPVSDTGSGSPNLLLYVPPHVCNTTNSQEEADGTHTPEEPCTVLSPCIEDIVVISSSNQHVVVPSATYHNATTDGLHRGHLSCNDTTATVSLGLWYWDDDRWRLVERTAGDACDASLVYEGPAGAYFWSASSTTPINGTLRSKRPSSAPLAASFDDDGDGEFDDDPCYNIAGQSSKPLSTEVILFITAGAVAATALLVFLIYLLVLRHRRRHTQEKYAPPIVDGTVASPKSRQHRAELERRHNAPAIIMNDFSSNVSAV